jgi:hypothetical protein
MKIFIRFSTALAAAWLLATLGARAAQTNTILLRAIDSGYYDRYGERDPRIKAGLAGFSAYAHARGPARSFAAFEIPNVPGPITNATLVADVYSISPDGAETLQLRDVTTPVILVRNGGLSLSNIYADLDDGTIYGSASFSSGNYYNQDIPLNGSAVAAVNAARGQQFAFGGSLADANSEPIYNEFISFPYYLPDEVRLRLEATVPVEPIIYTQPPGRSPLIYSNAAFFTVGACGAPPLTYYWFVDGVTDGPRSFPDFYMQWLTTTQQSVFVVVSNSFGSATSIVSQVQAKPAQLNPPFTNLTVRVGENVVISPVAAIFAYPYSTEWRKDGVRIPAPFPYSVEIYSAQLSNSGDYTLSISNAFGAITSAVMHLQVVQTPPVFWEDPYDQRVPLGSYVYVQADAKGGPPPVLRWYREGISTPVNENDGLLYIPAVSNTETGRYYVVASNALGVVTSRVATITAYLDPPVITTQPQSQTAYPGSAVLFQGYADGNPSPQPQWYFNGAPLPGERSSQLWLSNVSSNNAGAYFLVASNASGSATSQIATLAVPYLPPVLSGPPDMTIAEGSAVSLLLLVSNPPVHLRWQRNGANIPGSDSVTLYQSFPYYVNFFVFASHTNNGALYSAVVSNAYGFTTSRVATLTVTSAPPGTVNLFPSILNVLEGTKVEFTAAATGAPLPQIALYRNGTDTGVPHVDYKFTLPAVTPADTGDYVAIASNRVGIASSGVARLNVQRAGPLDRWNVRSPIPQGNDLFAVTYGGGKFVAVGRNGTLISSADGTNWNLHNIRTTAELNDVAYGNGRFIAVGEESLLLTSTNAENWSIVPTAPGLEFFAAAYGDGRFIVVGRPNFTASPKILLSSNGVDWVDATFPTPSASWLRTVAYGAGAFVTTDMSAQTLRSTDLVNWVVTANNLNGVEAVKFLNGGFVAVGNAGLIAASSDGSAWTLHSVNTGRIYDVSHGAGRYVAVGARGLIIEVGNPADVWMPIIPPTVNRLEGIVFGNDLFVAVGEGGTILTFNDGQSWANQVRVTGEDLDGMTVGGGLAIAVGKNDTILTSPNGRDWTRATLPAPTNAVARDWHGVGYGDGKFVVVGETKEILVSTNGVDWERRGYDTPLSNPYLKSVTYGAGVWVAVGEQGQILTSADTTLWLPFDATVPYDLNEVTYGHGTFVVVGDQYPNPNATILTSTDGTNWSNQSFFTGKNSRGITFANGLFVVTMNDGRIIYSADPDIYDWTYAFTPVISDGSNLRGVTWSNGLWVAVGNNGLLLTSTNAAVWKRRVTPTEENLHAVRYINGTFVAVGNAGTILQSDPLVSQLVAGREGTNLRLTLSSPNEGILKLQYADVFVPFPPTSPWRDLAFITNVVGTVDYTVPLPAGGGHKFYRVIAP